MVRFTTTVLFLLCGTAVAQSDSWPRWRGAAGTDHSPDKGLLKEWPDGGPKRVWLFEKAGKGYSGFSIADGHIYTMGTRDGEACALCIDFATGKEVWVALLGKLLKNNWGDGPRSTPTVDGDHLFVITGPGEVACLKRSDGKKVWSKMLSEFGGKVPFWGYSESLTVDGHQVICTPGGSEGALVALNKKTGKKIWQSTNFTGKAEYSSVVKANIHGKPQYVRLLQKKIAGIDASNGEVIWSADWPGRTAVCPTPIIEGSKVYVTSGYGVGSMMVEVKKDGSSEVLWQNKVMRNHHGGVIKIGDYLYGHADYAWVCQKWDDGEEVWRERKLLKKGAVHYADGMLYCVEESSGRVALVEASPEGYKETSRFTLEPQSEIRSRRGKIWVHPVVLGGRMLLRDQEYIYCYDVKGDAQAPKPVDK